MTKIFALLLLFVGVVLGCTQDWECGNPVFVDCVTEPVCSLLPGVGASPNRAYWLERCNDTVYLVRGGTLIQEVAVLAENTALYPGQVVQIIAANFRAVYVEGPSYVGELTQWFEDFLPERLSASIGQYPWSVTFDEDAGISYVCNGTNILKYNTLNFTINDQPTILYDVRAGICSNISFDNDTLYWNNLNMGTTRFYEGSVDCAGCSLPAPFTVMNGNIVLWHVSSGALYYVQGAGIQVVSLDSVGISSPEQVVAAENINSFQISGDLIFFNDGTRINIVHTDGTGLTTLSNVSHEATGECQCSNGFSGADCQECLGGSVQWEAGVPYCVSTNSLTGFPVSCFADYQCGPVPFVNCTDNICKCQTGEYGIAPSCSQCSDGKQLMWNDGIPLCA